MAEVSGWRIRILRGRSPALGFWVMVSSDASVSIPEPAPAVPARAPVRKPNDLRHAWSGGGLGVHSAQAVFLREAERPLELLPRDAAVERGCAAGGVRGMALVHQAHVGVGGDV